MPAPNDPSSLAKTHPFPEHEKLHKVVKESQAIGEFVEEFLPSKGIFLGVWTGTGSQARYADQSISTLLAEFFGIDRDALDREKAAMIDELKRANETPVVAD